LPDRALLADLCREAAACERVQPQLIEKDFYLTRILWALGQSFGDRLLLKGGTLLSKVDLGFFRLSEDADLVLPGPPSRQKLTNARRMHRIRDVLKEIGPVVGSRPVPGWGALRQGDALLVAARLSVRVRAARHPARGFDTASSAAAARSRLGASSSPIRCRDVRAAKCFALDAAEARAEKVRAAFTREAVRDFYDLNRLRESGADLSSSSFIGLVDEKLAELRALPMAKQGKHSAEREAATQMEAGLTRDLPAVLRMDAPGFDLDGMLARFDRLWRK